MIYIYMGAVEVKTVMRGLALEGGGAKGRSRIRFMILSSYVYRSGKRKLRTIAFSVGSRENVIALTDRIAGDGYALLSPSRETGDGYFESCVADPDGNRIEITA